jgi:UDP-galactopyranose mutase
MFKYNNMDHSILTGLLASQNILAGQTVHDIWDVNTEEEYHEEKRDVVQLPKHSDERKAAA